MTNWETTSDSLAAWLSTSLNAERLMIVKSCEVEANAPLEALASKGILDRRFAAYVRDANYVVEVLSKSDVGVMRDRLLNVAV
jgi:5-(aminomethyl)-3-furanmethanol phosphate kinase